MSLWLQLMYSSWEVSKSCSRRCNFIPTSWTFFFNNNNMRPVIQPFSMECRFVFPLHITTWNWWLDLSALTEVPDLFSCCQEWGQDPGQVRWWWWCLVKIMFCTSMEWGLRLDRKWKIMIQSSVGSSSAAQTDSSRADNIHIFNLADRLNDS